MDLTRTALLLDGRGTVDELLNSFTLDEPGLRWLCWLYGYRLEQLRQVGRTHHKRMLAVLDQDPVARARAAWMRAPDLRPGAPAPVPWTSPHTGAPAPWTPPGWLPGCGPLRPAADRMPRATAEQVRADHHPAGLLVIGGGLGVVAAALAPGAPVLAAVLGVVALAFLAGYLPARNHRDRLLAAAADRRPPYDPPPGGPPPPPPPPPR
ncbi:hypothetical protein HUT16_02760 [Kitasatospora sp. NA04385]|uniref:hypothetical protein n=1 Tax=Kitasatospora sp. NA04385 TaxID=2742135 RepID=UPI00159191A9|nr:hypothetical protein [Kitasatospora sp. NA04385]QKW18124.1 hypothetical protein HUT16_02760 [Kitasatospora sp. NA04385]